LVKNKFAHPPYLKEFNPLVATKLRRILMFLSETCCKFTTVEGAIVDIDLLISQPSKIRKCDLYRLRSIQEAIERLEKLGEKKNE
jgi:hypothetical protein